MRDDIEEIDADEDEEVIERVAAIDVAKASGKGLCPFAGRATTDHAGPRRLRNEERDHGPRR
jgi:hypothetical protein